MTGQDGTRSLAQFEAAFRRFRNRVMANAAHRGDPRPPRRGATLRLVEHVFD